MYMYITEYILHQWKLTWGGGMMQLEWKVPNEPKPGCQQCLQWAASVTSKSVITYLTYCPCRHSSCQPAHPGQLLAACPQGNKDV